MPVILHRHLRTVCILLLGFIVLGSIKLKYLSDPADVDVKPPNTIAKPSVESKSKSQSQSIPAPTPAILPVTTRTNTNEDNTSPTTTLPTGSMTTPEPTTIKVESIKTKRIKNGTTYSNVTRVINSTLWQGSIQQTHLNFIPESVATLDTSSSVTPKGMTTRSFVDDHCALEIAVEWFPSTPETKWQQRAPYVVIVGALEAGIPSISKRLAQHSQLLEHNHPPFFLVKNFKSFLTPSSSSTTSNKKPKVGSARQYFYTMDNAMKELKTNESLKSFETSTGYLFWSSTVPQNILCTCPWTKIIVVLRNPVDRLMAQYQSAVRLGLKLNMEAWIEPDLQLFKDIMSSSSSSSLHDETTTTTTFSSANTTLSSWSTYLSLIRGDAPIGRGMYEIQLRQWLSILHEMDKLNDILILNYEDWRRAPTQVWTRILDFLHLPDEVTLNLPIPAEPVAPTLDDGSLMDPSLRKKLIKYYKPYNRKLYDLLGWDRVWDK